MDDTKPGIVGNLITLLNAVGQDTVGIWYFISVVCYLGGFVLFGLGILYLARRPSSRQTYGTLPTAWFWNMAVGVCLFAFPEFLATVAATFVQGGSSEISQFDYSSMLKGGMAGVNDCSLNGMRPILQIIGAFFCIKALLNIRRATTYSSAVGQITFGSQVLIIVAGVMMIHMKHVLSGIYSLTGISLGQMC